jgi:hypothetical protein
MDFNERFVEGRPRANFETAFNMYLDEECATFEDAQAFFNACWARRAMTERYRRGVAQKEAERAALEEQEEAERGTRARLDSLRKQLREA